jgi:hypothetical protein
MKASLLRFLAALTLTAAGVWTLGSSAHAACCYFSAQNADILQPSQKAFITWDPTENVETFTVQPKFEGNAVDFGMVIPTPSRPKLHEMPRDFFKHLAVYGILKKRLQPESKLLPRPVLLSARAGSAPGGGGFKTEKKSTVVVLESGVVGSLDYKIISADRADDVYQWLKDNKYSYAGDEATLNHYVQKKWIFTVMKIDTMQMKRNKDGTYAGEVTPTRFQFTSEKLIYPLKITQISVKDKTEALLYIQAPYKVDLPGDLTYQYTWIPMLQSAVGCTPDGLPGKGMIWLKDFANRIPTTLARAKELGFVFRPGQRPQPGKDGHIPTTMEWARRLTGDDIKLLRGEAPFGDVLPNVDEGFTKKDVDDPESGPQVRKVILDRLEKARQAKPDGYLVREAPADDVKQLRHLVGHLKEGQFLTKLRHTFLRDEMNDDLLIVQARYGEAEDRSEYLEMLPTSPP